MGHTWNSCATPSCDHERQPSMLYCAECMAELTGQPALVPKAAPESTKQTVSPLAKDSHIIGQQLVEPHDIRHALFCNVFGKIEITVANPTGLRLLVTIEALEDERSLF
jgi:hypothetical protein